MYKIKRRFNNGVFECFEIYHDKFKIKEKSKGILWNATHSDPIVIPALLRLIRKLGWF